ncbi:MAG: zinc ribbon domain-containing protein [Desulfovibrio sp.]|nr:zinc ribbon domain-containing protein [Desulfovibrio sp.]
MPIYEYLCPHCQNVFEEWVKVANDQDEEPCPKCGTPAPKMISHTSFVLKGGGWYVTEYGNRKGIKEESNTAQEKSTKTETKPTKDAAKTETKPTKDTAKPAQSVKKTPTHAAAS